MLLLTKGVQRTKNKHLDNMWWTINSDNQKSYAAILRQTRLLSAPTINEISNSGFGMQSYLTPVLFKMVLLYMWTLQSTKIFSIPGLYK